MWISIGGLIGLVIPLSRINPKTGQIFCGGSCHSGSPFLGVFVIAFILNNCAMTNVLNIIVKYPVVCSTIGLLIGIGGTNGKTE